MIVDGVVVDTGPSNENEEDGPIRLNLRGSRQFAGRETPLAVVFDLSLKYLHNYRSSQLNAQPLNVRRLFRPERFGLIVIPRL